MPNLTLKNRIYIARFRSGGKEYKRSLGTTVESEAQEALVSIDLTLRRLRQGALVVPDGIDPGDFIVSGGTLVTPATPAAAPNADRQVLTIRQLISRYKKYEQKRAAETYYACQLTHLRHFRKFLGKARYGRPCDEVTRRTVERFIEKRLAIRDPSTVYKESITLRKLFAWAVKKKYLVSSPAHDKLDLDFGSDRPVFRTISEIQEIQARDGLTDSEMLAMWECLYLSPAEIAGLLQLVRNNADNEHSFLLYAIAAYCGTRRGEILRLKWLDVDLRNGFVTAISRKQSRVQKETNRKIALHPELRLELEAWRSKSRKGQYVLCDQATLQPLSPDRANRCFWQPLRHTEWQLDGSRNWFKIGFHTFRHSFASNLAAANVSPAIIDQWMGHTTISMRKRYEHLRRDNLHQAMKTFSLAVPITSGSPPVTGQE